MYLQCVSHLPNLESDKITESKLDAPKMIAVLRKDEQLFKKYFDEEIANPHKWFVSIGAIKTRCNRFIEKHPNCKIIVVDEHGQTYV